MGLRDVQQYCVAFITLVAVHGANLNSAFFALQKLADDFGLCGVGVQIPRLFWSLIPPCLAKWNATFLTRSACIKLNREKKAFFDSNGHRSDVSMMVRG